MIEEDLVAYVKVQVPLVGGRLDPLVLRQNQTLPALTYQVIDTPRTYSHDGQSLARPRFQWNCWGKSYNESKQVARELRLALNNYKGMMGASRVDRIEVTDQSDDYQPDTQRYRQIVDVIVWHNEEGG